MNEAPPLPVAWLRRLELAGAALLLVAALVPRARDLDGSFDRHFEGGQAGFFALCAVNYERLGFWTFGGYPVLNIDLFPDRPESWYEYANHPPAVPWMAYAGLQLLGPDGWEDELAAGRPPQGIETAVRLPFLLAHVFGLATFWWAVRQASGPRRAMLALAILAALPLSALYATLVNYETPSIPFACLALGFYARYARSDDPARRRSSLWGMAIAFGLGCSVTYAPAFFLPPLVLQRLLARRVREAVTVGATGLAGILVPVALHGYWSRRQLASIDVDADGLVKRVGNLAGPLFRGEPPFGDWLALQGELLLGLASWPVCIAAGVGAVWLVVRSLPIAPGSRESASLEMPFTLGGFTMLLAFYQHTATGQDTFLLNLAPALCVLPAAVLDRIAPTLYRLRGGIGPLVAVTGLIVLPEVTQIDQLRRQWRAPGPNDPVDAGGPPAPLPRTVGAELHELLPPGVAAMYPGDLGFQYGTYYYAWRSLFHVASLEESGVAQAHFANIGLEGAPMYLMFPLDPPPAAAGQVDAVRALFEATLPDVAARPPDRRTPNWEAWLLVH